MAPRVQVDTSSLRRLDQKTAVIARPVDTMVSVSNQVQQNSKLMQTANALAQVNPKLTKYLQDGQIQRNEEDQDEGTAAWQKANDEEKKAYLKAIKSGEIDEVESPFFIKGMSKGVLRDRARDYGQQLVIGWNAQKDTKGFNLDKFLSETKDDYIKEHGLDGFADNIFNSEFGRLAEAYGNQVSQRNYEDRLKKTRQARLTLLGKDVVGAAAKATSNNGKFNATTYIAEVNKVMEEAISEGLDPTNSRQQVLAQLESLATTDVENSKAYIDAAAQLSTRYGKYGETGKGALWVAEKNEFFENKAERDADDDWQENQRAEANAIMDATQAMYKSIVEDPDYLNTKVGQFALDTMAGLRGGGGEKAQQFRNQHEHDAIVITDPEEYAAVAASIETGAGNVDAEYINGLPNINGPDKNKLIRKLGTGPRLEVALSNLGPVDYITSLEKFATKRDPNDPLASIYGTVSPSFSVLGDKAREAASDVILEADKQFDLTTADGQTKARTYIREQLDILKKDIEDQRTEIRGKELESFNASMGGAGALTTDKGGSLDKTTATEASVAGVLPEAIPIYSFLPQSALNNAAVEAKRPVSQVLPKKYDTFTTGPILEFTKNADIQSLMQEYAAVFKNPDQPFTESKLVNMAMQYGVTVEELGNEITKQMEANLKATIEEEDRERRIEEEDAAMNADFPQPTTMNEPYSVEGSDPNAQALLETVTDELVYDASEEQINLLASVLSGYDLSDINGVAAQVQEVFPNINEKQLRDIIQRVGPTAAPEGVDMASPSMVSPTSGMQAPSMSSASPDGTVDTGVAPQSGISMMPAASKVQLPEAGKQDKAVAPVSRQDERQMRKVLRDLRTAEAQQLSALEAEADKVRAAADLKRLNAKEKKEALAEIARQRKQRQQEFLKEQSLRKSKIITEFIAERAEKYPEKFGVTMSDDLDSYLAKTKPLWFALWGGILADGQEIPDVFYEVLKENMRRRIPN